jgi:hypothetical protein
MGRGGEEDEKAIEGLRSVAQAFASTGERQAAALRRLATAADQCAREEIQRCGSRIPSLLLGDLDPLHFGWNPFRLLSVADDEPRWTQWLHRVGSDAPGSSSALIWRALCTAVADNADLLAPKARNRHPLAGSASWRAAASETHVNWQAEVPSEGLGTIDLVVQTASILNAGIEVKLWEDWHDSERPQADRYRDLVARMQEHSPRQMVGLVLLTCREDVEVPGDYVRVTWREFARNIRRQLRSELAGDVVANIRGLLPAILTAASIETELLGLRYMDHDAAPLRHLTQWSALVTYLEESRARRSS